MFLYLFKWKNAHWLAYIPETCLHSSISKITKGKIGFNFVSLKLILHNQSHDIVELMKSNSLLETDRRKSHSLSARQLRRLFFLTQFAESVFFSSPCQTKELVAQLVKTREGSIRKAFGSRFLPR